MSFSSPQQLDCAGRFIQVGDSVRIRNALGVVRVDRSYRRSFRKWAGRIAKVVGWDETGLAWIPNGKEGVLSIEPRLLRLVKRPIHTR